MKIGSLLILLALLALLLIAAYGLHTSDYLFVVGAVATLVGWRFAFVLALFFLTAAATALLPAWRFGILLGVSLLQLFVLRTALQAAGALVLWAAFYAVVHLPIGWWLKGPAIASLYAAPFLVARLDPGSALTGILLVTLFTSNFVLRSALYAYEATQKSALLRGAGFPGFLLYLIAAPVGAVKLEPIGFVVLHRRLKTEADLGLMQRGVSQMALGFLYLALRQIGIRIGLFPGYEEMLQAASDLNTLGALAACHVLLVRLFLDVTGHIHVAVGMLRVVGFDIPVGSERPYQSRNVLDFWRRWNTYYRDYVMALAYYPLAVFLKRRPVLAVAAAGAATFLLSGFAHAAQYALRRPEQSSFESFVEGQVWAAVFGSLVVVWMLSEAAQGRRRRDHAAGPAEAAPWTGLRGAMAAFVTLSLVSVILLLLHPPLAGQPLATSMSLLAAFLRPPWL